ncbi:MAG: hypothetical protein Q4G45_04960 [Actinomycetia bacterium]|nr:hypothetical protein [Actinomycetes bacterium]
MADSADRVYELLHEARQVPYEQRAPLLTEAVRLADELGSPELGVKARQELTAAYAMTGEASQVFVPFSRVLQHYQSGVPFDDAMLFRLLWHYKWVVCDLLEFPEVPLAQLEQSLQGMLDLDRQVGEGLQPAYACAFRLAHHVRGARAALPEFDAWTAEPRTGLSDCEACERDLRAGFYVDLGRWEDALEEAVLVIAGNLTCNTQPAEITATVLEPLLQQGQASEAAVAHLRGWRMTRGRRNLVFSAATHIWVLARTGAVERGLELLGTVLPELDERLTPMDEMYVSAAATRLLDAVSTEEGLGQLPVATETGPAGTVDQLRAELRLRATRLAGRFDQRNQTSRIGQWVEQVMSAGPLPAMPLGAPAARNDTDQDRIETVRLPQAPQVHDLASLSPEELSRLVEELQRYGTNADLERVADHWRTRADAEEAVAGPSPQRLHVLGELAYLVVWCRRQMPLAEAERWSERAAGLLRRAGDEAEALLVEQAVAGRRGDLEAMRSLLPRIDQVGSVVQRGRARWRLVHFTVDTDELAELTRQVRQMPIGADSTPQERRVWAMSHYGPSADLDTYDDFVRTGLSVLQPGEYPETQVGLRLNLVRFYMATQRPQERDVELDLAEELARASGEPVLLASVLEQRAQVAAAEDSAAAESYLLRAIALTERAHMVEALAACKGRLADLLRDQGRLLEAAEQAESALAILDLEDGNLSEARRLQGQYARLARLAGVLAGSLDEPVRAVGLLKRALEEFEEWGMVPEAAETASDAGDYAAQTDAVEAVRLYRRAIELAQRCEHWVILLVTTRDLANPVFDADGPDAAFRALDESVRWHEELEARALVDPEVREKLEGWRFDLAKQELRIRRARLLGAAERFDEAVAVLGDAPEQLLQADAEVMGLNAQLLRARLLLGGGRVDEGLRQLEPLLEQLTTWGDQDSLVRNLAGLGARALAEADREAEADAFWEKWTQS